MLILGSPRHEVAPTPGLREFAPRLFEVML